MIELIFVKIGRSEKGGGEEGRIVHVKYKSFSLYFDRSINQSIDFKSAEEVQLTKRKSWRI